MSLSRKAVRVWPKRYPVSDDGGGVAGPTRKVRKSAEHHPWIVFMKLYLAKTNRGRAQRDHVRYFKVLKEASPKYKALVGGIAPLDKKEFTRAERQKHLCAEIRRRFEGEVAVGAAAAVAGGRRGTRRAQKYNL